MSPKVVMVPAVAALVSTALAGWVQVGPRAANIQAMAMAPTNPSIGYAAMDNSPDYRSNVLRTTDGGQNWDSVGQIHERVITAMAGDQFDGHTVYATNGSYRLYRSTDGAATWSSVTLPNSGRGEVVAGDQFTPGLVYVAGRSRVGGYDRVTLFISTDYGVSWSSRAADTSRYSTGYACLASRMDTGTVYIAGSKGVIAKTTNRGQTWTLCNNGLPSATVVQSLDQHQEDPDIIVAGCSTGVYRTTNRGASWSRTSQMVPFSRVVLSPAEPDVGYAAHQEVNVTTDGGATWFVPVPGLRFKVFRGLAAHRDSGRWAYACGTEGIYRTSDAGTNWAPTVSRAGGVRVPCIGVCSGDPSHIYAAVRGSAVYKSTSGADSWTRCEPFEASDSICAIGVGPDPDVIYALEGWT
ncbi:MAG: hypothetical protein JSU73_03640 [candidate division WOR-3 bacterium]|nr:MAG: hypothetical protein JSU73_03640 [candidate division WOR-3 bacterium]